MCVCVKGGGEGVLWVFCGCSVVMCGNWAGERGGGWVGVFFFLKK